MAPASSASGEFHILALGDQRMACTGAPLTIQSPRLGGLGRGSALVVFLLLAAGIAPFVFILAMTDGLTHDEHQHIAAGVLYGRDGLLPYRDFAVFHTPYLTFLYGWIFRFTDHLLLGARLFSAVCATAFAALVGLAAFNTFPARGQRLAWSLAIGSAGLCLTANLFTHTTGHAWNQEPAAALAIGSFLFLGHGIDSKRPGSLAFSGILLGLSIGMRITYAPLIAPFGLATLLGTESWAVRLRRASLFTGGLLAALAGVFAMLAAAPEAFLFDNFGFSQANIDYRMATGEPRTMTLLKKFRFLWKVIIRGDAGLMIATLTPLLTLLWLAWRKRAAIPARVGRFLLALPFILAGAMAPSPVFEQYFYPLVPFLVLAGCDALAALPIGSRAERWNVGIGAAGLLLGLISTIRLGGYHEFERLFRPDKWTPLEIHGKGLAIRAHLPAGRVLTLGPLLPLEGGLQIDPAFATGPFAWRVAAYLDPAKAQRLHFVTPSTLATHLAALPPDAVLTGAERAGEEPLEAYALERGFKAVPLEGEDHLWIAPR